MAIVAASSIDRGATQPETSIRLAHRGAPPRGATSTRAGTALQRAELVAAGFAGALSLVVAACSGADVPAGATSAGAGGGSGGNGAVTGTGGDTSAGSDASTGSAGAPPADSKLRIVDWIPLPPDSGIPNDMSNQAHGGESIFECLQPGPEGCELERVILANQDAGVLAMLLHQDGSHEVVYGLSTKIGDWGGPYNVNCVSLARGKVAVYCASPLRGDLEPQPLNPGFKPDAGIAVLDAELGNLIGEGNGSRYSRHGFGSIAVSPDGSKLIGARVPSGVWEAPIDVGGALGDFVKESDESVSVVTFTEKGKEVWLTQQGKVFVDGIPRAELDLMPIHARATGEVLAIAAGDDGVAICDLEDVSAVQCKMVSTIDKRCAAYSAHLGAFKDPTTQVHRTILGVGCADKALVVDDLQTSKPSVRVQFGGISLEVDDRNLYVVDWRQIIKASYDPSAVDRSVETNPGEVLEHDGEGTYAVLNSGEAPYDVEAAEAPGGSMQAILQPGESRRFPVTQAQKSKGFLIVDQKVRLLDPASIPGQYILAPGDVSLSGKDGDKQHNLQLGCSGQLPQLKVSGGRLMKGGTHETWWMPPVSPVTADFNDVPAFALDYAGIPADAIIPYQSFCPQFDPGMLNDIQAFQTQCVDGKLGLFAYPNKLGTQDYTVTATLSAKDGKVVVASVSAQYQ